MIFVYLMLILVKIRGDERRWREIDPDVFDNVVGYDNFVLLEFFQDQSLLIDSIEYLEEEFEIFDLYIFCIDSNKYSTFATSLGVSSFPSLALFYNEEHYPRSITDQFENLSSWLENSLPETSVRYDTET